MPGELQQEQQFDQLLDTFVACRSAVRYNSTLSEQQKSVLLTDIDQAVRFLRNYLVVRAPIEDYTDVSPYLPSPLANRETMQGERNENRRKEKEKEAEDKLQDLYRVYHSYVNMQQSNNVETFITRFNTVMVAITEVQHLLECTQTGGAIANTSPLEHITGFVVDLYYMFVEFIRALSDALEANDVHIDTEELELSRLGGHLCGHAASLPQFLAPLIKTYEMHQRFNTRLGRLTHRISDTTAFLEFLEECLDIEGDKREMIISQLNSASRLLKDLSLLLVDYEIATAIVLRSRMGM